MESCVICLEAITERAFAVPCNHCAFDYLCLLTWLESKAEFPLCKAQVTAVEFDWSSPTDYKTYRVPKQLTPPPETSTQYVPSPRPERQSQHRQRRSYSPVSQPLATFPRPSMAPTLFRGPHLPPSPSGPQRLASWIPQGQHLSSMNLRSPLPAARPRPAPRIPAEIRRRRFIYQHRLFSAYVGANRISQQRDFTPEQFSSSARLQSRARMWIRRELQVFDFLSPDYEGGRQPEHGTAAAAAARRVQNAEFVLEYIMSVLRVAEIRGSGGQALAKVAEMLGDDDTPLFLHELNSWLRSPFDRLEDWDRYAQYSQPLPDFRHPPHPRERFRNPPVAYEGSR